MPTRSSTTLKKRQREIARMEKQRDKAAKRMERKLAPKAPEETDEMLLEQLMQSEPASGEAGS
jgi:protein subunit release factor A